MSPWYINYLGVAGLRSGVLVRIIEVIRLITNVLQTATSLIDNYDLTDCLNQSILSIPIIVIM